MIEKMQLNTFLRIWVGDTQLYGTSISRLTISSQSDIVRLSARLPSEIAFWKYFPDGGRIDLRRVVGKEGDLVTRENSVPYLSFVACEKIGFFSNPLVPANSSQTDAVTFHVVFRCHVMWHFLEGLS